MKVLTKMARQRLGRQGVIYRHGYALAKVTGQNQRPLLSRDGGGQGRVKGGFVQHQDVVLQLSATKIEFDAF